MDFPRVLGTREKRWTLAACVFTFSLGIVLAMPVALARWRFEADALGYIVSAQNWLEGRGWIEPVLYSYFIDGETPPISSFAIRPPVLSVLLAGPIALGAELTTLSVLHVIWASLIGTYALLVAKRLVSLSGAWAFALATAGSAAWVGMSDVIMTEATSVGVALLFLAHVNRGLASARGALGLSFLLLIGYFTRPNLGILLPAACLAFALEHGIKATLRSKPIWILGLSFFALKAGVTWTIEHFSGAVLFENYGIMGQWVTGDPIALFNCKYAGLLAFVRENNEQVFGAILDNCIAWRDAFFFDFLYMRAGWLAVPALYFGLVRPKFCGLTERTAAFAALGFTGVAVMTYGGFDVSRYPLQGFVFLQLLNVLLLVRLVERLRWSQSIPLVIVATVWLVDLVPVARTHTWDNWVSYLNNGTIEIRSKRDLKALELGALIDRNAILASPNPWRFYFWWGIAGHSIPEDLENTENLHLYLDKYNPGYLFTRGNPPIELLAGSDRLKPILIKKRQGLFEVLNPSEKSRPWIAPAPMFMLGREQAENE